MKVARTAVVWLALMGSGVWTLEAARISEVTDQNFWEQAGRFFSLQDAAVRYALPGCVLLGFCCGLIGVFLVVRRMALLGDALAHAVLPGVVLGFLWNMSRDPWAIFIGAVLLGLAGVGTVHGLLRHTRHKEDAALGFVLAAFYGLGICLLTMVQNHPSGAQAGLDQFLFGQAAALGAGEVRLLTVVALLCLGMVLLFYKEYRVVSFDPVFARTAGLPVRWLQGSLMMLLAFAIVASLQAVGVVLVSAMVVIPAATAALLTDRMGWMLILASVIGMAAGGLGAFGSFVGERLPTGPLMVMISAAGFGLAFLLAPRHGVFMRWWRQRCRTSRERRENLLKAIYQIMEDGDFARQDVSLGELAARRGLSLKVLRQELRGVVQAGEVTQAGNEVALTPAGRRRAAEVVRNHRLWELYLADAAHMPPDHVHDNAEVMEHVLSEETVRRLERRLNYARHDPHGKPIPQTPDIHEKEDRPRPTAPGYGKCPEERP